jgi:hypothetical protein
MNDMIMRLCDLAQDGNIYTKKNFERLLKDLGISRDDLMYINVTGLTLAIFESFCDEPEEADRD